MKNAYNASSDNRKDNNFTFQVLQTIATAGAITAVMLMPGLAAAFSPSFKKRNRNQKARNRVAQIIWRLKKQNFIKEISGGKLLLTAKGEKALSYYRLRKLNHTKPKHWDGKWRVVAFDVWETRRSIRDIFRKILKNFGFVKLQASLWIYPYDCEEFIGLLRTHFHLFSAIQYMVVERIDNDYKLRKHFGLSLNE